VEKDIKIKGAKVHNLKNIDLNIPRDEFVVLTGLSGSGKSSLAFDTIYAEGQRRYIESLSAYARQFLGQMDKPDVESIEGLSPAISIDQKTTSKNPRSTVGTVTEIYDYLRLLYARVGIPHCPICGIEIKSQTVDQIVDNIIGVEDGSKIMVLAPVVRSRKGEHQQLFIRIKKEGFVRVRVDGEIYLLEEDEIKLDKNFKHTIEIVVDRIVIKDDIEGRLSESVELAIEHGDGLVNIFNIDNEEEKLYSTKLSCPEHGVSLAELEPRTFSFNSPYGACPKCMGLGFTQRILPENLIKDKDISILGGALGNMFGPLDAMGYYRQMLSALADYHNTNLDVPYNKLPKDFLDDLFFGTEDRKIKYKYTSKNTGAVSHMNHTFEGIVNSLERRYRETDSEYIKEKIGKLMELKPCPECLGKRLKPEVLSVTVADKNISEITDLSIKDAARVFKNLKLSETKMAIANEIIKEINERLNFLVNVGLDYLTMSRSSGTLSGGEAQRIRLATQIGSKFMGVLYILDEPSIGLHQRDNNKLLGTLRELTNIGNTLLVVEHDEETIREADHIVDIGPGAGIHGGEVVAQGTAKEIIKNPKSITGKYLSGEYMIDVPKNRREGKGTSLVIKGAKENNLKDIDAEFPLGKFVCVTGVSGSGKSSLVNEILYKGTSMITNKTLAKPGKHDDIIGTLNIDKVIDINQSPIGKTPRSNPATYTGMFTAIRDLFASLPEAKIKGFDKGRFSFNVKGGRCEACKGDGILKIEMHFLPDVYVPCDVCKGKRYNRETLEVKYKGKNIFDVLDMSITEGLEFFKNHPSIMRHLETLDNVGLGYIKFGQPSTTLSGGEAQRIKLATELSKRSTGNTLYILDEPTTGLHFADVDKLLNVLDKLVDAGNTVVVIEHNLDVIKRADYIIDLGPEGGDGGGLIVATGTPEEIIKCKESYTGEYLKRVIN